MVKINLRYFNNPGATSRAFDKEGWFKTGDIVTLNPDTGVFKINGRASVDIIKTGGYKVSALEIEREILTHPNVAEVAILGIPDRTYGQRIAAIIAFKDVLLLLRLLIYRSRVWS